MAIDFEVAVAIASGVSDDRKAEIMRKILEVLESETINAVAPETFAAGSGHVSSLKLTITT